MSSPQSPFPKIKFKHSIPINSNFVQEIFEDIYYLISKGNTPSLLFSFLTRQPCLGCPFPTHSLSLCPSRAGPSICSSVSCNEDSDRYASEGDVNAYEWVAGGFNGEMMEEPCTRLMGICNQKSPGSIHKSDLNQKFILSGRS